VSTRKASKGATNPFQPWHIAIFVVALVLGIWQLSKFAVDARAAGDVNVIKSDQPTPMPATASQSTIRRFRDKDADSER
jgi:hypothetical protein